MPKKLSDLLRLALPLPKMQKELFLLLENYLEAGDIAEIKSMLKQKKADIGLKKLHASPQVAGEQNYPVITTNDKEKTQYIEKVNQIIEDHLFQQAFRNFSEKAHEMIPKLIAMNIVGMDEVKKAAAIQLFARFDEPVHILLLGDPSTGKTDILRSASSLHPVSSFGLGSGTTGVGLTVTIKGKEVNKGLLPMADKGLCAIDELNLMEDKDRAALYNAMEKGFLTYDKQGKHYKFDARVKVIATANPKGDKFVGWTLETLKKQLPFDSALLSRFHMVFLIRKPDIKNFIEISRKIIKNEKKKSMTGDEKFIQKYVEHAEKIEVDIPSGLEQEMVEFVSEIKKNEKRFLIEVSPRLVIGFVRLAKASARMRLARTVEQKDIDFIKQIVTRGLQIR